MGRINSGETAGLHRCALSTVLVVLHHPCSPSATAPTPRSTSGPRSQHPAHPTWRGNTADTMARLQQGSANRPPSRSHPHQPQPQPQNPQVTRHRIRHRSYSDPFSDPGPVHQKPVPRLPPEPPPKYPPHSRMASANKLPPRDNILDAVRDTVQFKSSEQPPRSRTGRSLTVVGSVSFFSSLLNPHPPSKNSNQPAGAPRTHGRRSMSQDSVLHAANALEKAKAKPRGKKGSAHADVIDRLDFSGVGPSMSFFKSHPLFFPSSSFTTSVSPRWSLRCLCAISQPSSHQSTHARLEQSSRRRCPPP